MSPDTHSCTYEFIFTARFLEGLLGFIHGAVEDDQPLPMRHILFAIGAEHEPCRGRESPCSSTRKYGHLERKLMRTVHASASKRFPRLVIPTFNVRNAVGDHLKKGLFDVLFPKRGKADEILSETKS
jgi:hypothetical protein